MPPRQWAGLLVSALGLVLLARVATALLPAGLALAAWVALGGVGLLLVVVCLGSTKED